MKVPVWSFTIGRVPSLRLMLCSWPLIGGRPVKTAKTLENSLNNLASINGKCGWTEKIGSVAVIYSTKPFLVDPLKCLLASKMVEGVGCNL